MHVFITLYLRQVCCILTENLPWTLWHCGRAVLSSLFSLWREWEHTVLLHMIIPQTKTRTSCPHQDTYLQQADASKDPAIWTHGSRTPFIFIHPQKNQRQSLLCLILIPVYSSLSVFSLTFCLQSRSETIQSYTASNKHNLAMMHGS